MSSVAHELELTVAEGLLGALDTPRGLDTARLLLKDDGLSAGEARVLLEEMLHPRTCAVCGGDPCSCGLDEADGVADEPVLAAGEEMPAKPRKRRRAKRKKKGAKMEEATSTGDGSTPGDPATQTRTAWGGVPYAGQAAMPGRQEDRDIQPRVGRGMVDVVLTQGATFTTPPNLRDADGWDRCGNCVFFGKDLCNLYGWDRPENGELVHRAGIAVDRNDVCDSHLTLTPPVQRLVEALDREDEQLAEAARAANSMMVVRARARVERAKDLLDEAIDVQLEEMWSDEARAAALVARREHRHGDRFGTQVLSRDRGESALHYAMRRLQDKPEGAMRSKDTAKALYGANHPHRAHGRRNRSVKDVAGERLSHQVRGPYGMGESVVSKLCNAKVGSGTCTKLAGHSGGHDAKGVLSEAVVRSRLAIREVSSDAYPGLDRSPKENWVDKAGGLPRYIERIAKHLHYEKGKPIGTAIAIAVNVVKKMCSSGDLNFKGKQNVNPKSRAEACAAVAEWERKKGPTSAKGHAENAARTPLQHADPWASFPAALALYEADFKPIPPSDRYVEALIGELAEEFGPDWMVGLAALDEADALLERYGDQLDEAESLVILDEAGVPTLFHAIAGFHGKWNPIAHPRAPRGRKGGGEFSRKDDVLAKIASKARGRGMGSRDSQRGYRHPEGASPSERMVAEMFDRVGPDRTIFPAERKTLGAYLRRRGNVSVAEKVEQGRGRSLSAPDQQEIARLVRGTGSTQTIAKKPTLPSVAGKAVKLNELPGRPSGHLNVAPDYRLGQSKLKMIYEPEDSRIAGRNTFRLSDEQGFTVARGERGPIGHLWAANEGKLLPSDGDAGKGGSDAGRVAGRKNEATGQAVDAAITTVLQGFPGLEDWHVQKVGDDYHLHVQVQGKEHVIGVSPAGKVTYLSGPQKKAAKASPMEKAPPGGWTEADKVPPKPKKPLLKDMEAPLPSAEEAPQPDPQWTKDHPALKGTNAEVMAWEHLIDVGHHVDVLWTNSNSHYGAHGEVVKKNAKSWVVQISHDVPTAMGGYKAGQKINVPRGDVFSSAGYSPGNSIRPYGSVKGLPNYGKPLAYPVGQEKAAKATKVDLPPAVNAHDEPSGTNLAHSLAALKDYEGSGQFSKPYHMEPNTLFMGHDGVLYEHLESGKHLMTSKNGNPLAASRVHNHKTGADKMLPAFVQQEYEIMVPKGTAPAKPTTPGYQGPDIASALKGSVAAHHGPGSIAGKSFVITGTLPGMTRDMARKKLEAAGGHYHSTVTAHTDLLITGEGVGTKKLADAASKGVLVVPHHQVKELMESLAEEAMAVDGFDRLFEVERQLSEATDTRELVRLRARRDVLTDRLFEALVAEAVYNAEQRRKYATVGEDGFPIGDEAHAHAALERLNQGGLSSADKRKVIAKAARFLGKDHPHVKKHREALAGA